jgi:hypothetical protein
MICGSKKQPLCSYCKGGVQFQWLPINALRVSGFCGEDGSIVELNAVSQINTVQLWPTCPGVLL